MQSRIHEVLQFNLITWSRNDRPRYGPVGSHVIASVMRRAVLAYQTCPVEAQYYRKILQCHVMYDFIISPLGE